MNLTGEFTVVSHKFNPPEGHPRGLTYPMIGSTPVAAIDLDRTLAHYDGWKGPDHIGPPRRDAIWALKCFKHNGWEVEIWTSRNHLPPIRDWLQKHAPGLVNRINKSRHTSETHDMNSTKPKVDLFIDDRNVEFFGKEVNWVHIMRVLDRRGYLPNGLLPKVA